MAAPLLDLSTLITDRPELRINGKIYHLKSPEELTLAESFQFSRWGKELEALGKDPNRTVELEALLREVSRAALADVPDEVFAQLSPTQDVSIVEVFTSLLLARKARLAGAVLSAGPSTGQSSSRVSSVLTAANQAGGSTAPQQRS